MKLYAISDLHLGYKVNRQALETLSAHPEDWLILGGDLGETADHLEFAFDTLAPRFRQLLWVPGNHELWTLPQDPPGLRGEAKYQYLVSLCQHYNVLTPEDPYPLWTGEGPTCVLAPLFLLYDYSFRPDHIPMDQALNWAVESGVLCVDEHYLHPDPYPSRQAWCEARCQLTAARLAEVPVEYPLVLINHFPLRQDLVRLSTIPRFSLWCGTRHTENWHTRFRAVVVISGHLHRPATDWRDGVRFEEVSLGYPRQWRQEEGPDSYLREILPGPKVTPRQFGGPYWHR
jgi:predicted phosphodiesterase